VAIHIEKLRKDKEGRRVFSEEIDILLEDFEDIIEFLHFSD
jgi:hypothetical protein